MSRFSRERSQPATSSASARGPSTRSFSIVLISGQSSASRRRHGSVRENAMSETATLSNRSHEPGVGLRHIAPFRRVDDETVGDADDLGKGHAPPARLAAPAAEHGQVGDEQRQHDRARVLRGGASAAGARSPPRAPRARGPAAGSPSAPPACRSSPRCPGTGSGRSSGRDGARAGRQGSRAPSRATRRAPHDVRHRARAQVGRAVVVLARAQAPQLALDVGDDAHDPPSGGARSARRGGSDRPPQPAPRCRSRSSGSSAGHAARRR